MSAIIGLYPFYLYCRRFLNVLYMINYITILHVIVYYINVSLDLEVITVHTLLF